MTTLSQSLFVAVSVIICLASCNNKNSENVNPTKQTGTPIDQVGPSYDKRVKLWKNGVAITLPDASKNSVGNSVFVVGNDVYVAGSDDKVAKLWKNGVATSLTDGTNKAEAKSVYVSGNDVYVVGYEYILGYNIAKIWKNGVPSSLSNGTSDAVAYSVCVVNNDVYIAGYSSKITGSLGIYVATIWKNGVAKQLSDIPSSANSVCFSGSDVYVGGEEHTGTEPIFKVWKNGIISPASDNFKNSFINSVYVSGNDVYAVGKQAKPSNGSNYIFASIWKNNAPTLLSDKEGVANSVFVSNNDVYVAGSVYSGTKTTVSNNTTVNEFGNNIAQVWKNGVGISLTDGTKQATANSVFVSGSNVYVVGFESDK